MTGEGKVQARPGRTRRVVLAGGAGVRGCTTAGPQEDHNMKTTCSRLHDKLTLTRLFRRGRCGGPEERGHDQAAAIHPVVTPWPGHCDSLFASLHDELDTGL